MRADQMLEDGYMAGAATWHRILSAIEREAKAPTEILTPRPALALRFCAVSGLATARREQSAGVHNCIASPIDP
jgi:hypothetical protein